MVPGVDDSAAEKAVTVASNKVIHGYYTPYVTHTNTNRKSQNITTVDRRLFQQLCKLL
jgi:hypothetical protein